MKVQNPIFDKAKETFGLTDEFALAGYLLPDGSLLDFAEGQTYQRTLDHRSINQIYDFTDQDGDTYNLGMTRFMNEGAMRMNIHAHSAGFDLIKSPTYEQKETLKKLFSCIDEGFYQDVRYQDHPVLYVDISNTKGKEKESLSFNLPLPHPYQEIFDDINSTIQQIEAEEEKEI